MIQISRTIKGISCVIGAFLLHFSLGTMYTFGNLSPYIASYLKYRTYNTWINNEHLVWVFSLNVFFLGLTMFFGGILEKKVGARITCLCGSWIMSIGTISTYFSIKSGIWMVIFSYGIAYGFGTGITYSVAVSTAIKWFPNKRGLVAGIVTAGFGLGSFIFNLIQTAYINPKNIPPNNTNSFERYFIDDTVLDKVPFCFVLIGVMYAIIQLVGVILLTDPNSEKQHKTSIKTSTVNNKKENMSNEKITTDMELEISSDNTEILKKTEFFPNESYDFQVKEAVKDCRFWILSFTFFFNGMFIVIHSSYYKSFGQTFISDDRYFSIVGAVASIFNSVGRIVWGTLVDIFSYRKVMTSLTVLKSLFIGSFFFCQFIESEIGSKIMFFFYVCLLFFCLSGSFGIFPAITSRCFGNKNLALIYGLIVINFSISGILGGFICSMLLSRIQYGGIFLIAAVSSLCSMILTQFFRNSITDISDKNQT